MIVSVADRRAEQLLAGKAPKGFPADLVRRSERKLAMIAAATTLGDLRQPPGNRLEALAGDLKGYHSIRINDQWRVIFVWSEKGAERVEVVDYH